MRMASEWMLALGLATALAGCGAPPAAAPKPAVVLAPVGLAERFLPLVNATVFAYDSFSEPSGPKGMLVLEVRRGATVLLVPLR